MATSEAIRTPFVILIDVQEKAPWNFSGLRARSFVDRHQRIYQPVRTERRYLGVGMGDYSLDGMQDLVAIERKSMSDFQGTLLGWPIDIEDAAKASTPREINRRGRFKNELAKLAALACKAVVVEATLGRCLDECPSWGERTAAENAKYLYTTYLSWQQQFAVPWIFCDDREMAVVTCFRILEKYWAIAKKARRQTQQIMLDLG